MEALASRLRKPLKYIGYLGVVVGFAGMIFIAYELIKSSFLLFTHPGLAPGIQPVLPIQVRGVFYVPFLFWIISIFVIAVVHEFSHGVMARAHNMKVKSSGFAFLGVLLPIIPAAFVEPDEKDMSRRSPWQQLSVFAAGPFSNIIFGLLIIFLFGFSLPGLIPEGITQKTTIIDIAGLSKSLVEIDGLRIVQVVEDTPAAAARIPPGVILQSVDGVAVADPAFPEALAAVKPGQQVVLSTDGGDYALELAQHPQDPDKGYMGLSFELVTHTSEAAIAKYGKFGTESILFGSSLLLWILILNLGIGLFNLLPLGPIDGGRMLHTVVTNMFNEKVGNHIWKFTSFFFLALILVNLTIGFIR